jgi:type II secretory pathway component PulF
VKNGQPLAKVMAKFPRVFDPMYRSVVNIGEESGSLDRNLDYLVSELTKAYEFRQKVTSALLYPMIVLLIAGIVGAGVALFVLPKLVDMFTSLDVKLPLTTRMLMWVAGFMKSYGIVFFAGLAGVVMAGLMLARTTKIKKKIDEISLKMPILGKFFLNIQVANMCRNMGIMLKSGLPLRTCLQTAREATGNWVFNQYFLRLDKAVDMGVSLEKELTGKHYPMIPLMVGRMVGVGEKSGRLDETFLYLGEFMEEEVDEMAKNLTTILEPVLLIGIALVVLFLAMSIISPIYQLTGSIRK